MIYGLGVYKKYSNTRLSWNISYVYIFDCDFVFIALRLMLGDLS